MSKMFNGLVMRFDKDFESQFQTENQGADKPYEMQYLFKKPKHLKNTSKIRSHAPAHTDLVGAFIGRLRFRK